MMNIIKTFVYVIALIIVPLVSSEYVAMEYPANSLCVYANAARFSLSKFVSKNSLRVKASCAAKGRRPLGPLCPNQKLNEAALVHSREMTDLNFFDHNSERCGRYGGSCGFASRIKYFYKDGNMWGENIIAGSVYRDTERAMAGWVESEGHCVNLMNDDYTVAGANGVFGSRTYEFIATQDFSNGRCDEQFVCGGHVPFQNKVKFAVAVNFDSSGNSVDLVVNGDRLEMSLPYGNQQTGVYEVEVDNLKKSGCNTYYFVASDGSQYPPAGQKLLQTNGYGNCNSGISDEPVVSTSPRVAAVAAFNSGPSQTERGTSPQQPPAPPSPSPSPSLSLSPPASASASAPGVAETIIQTTAQGLLNEILQANGIKPAENNETSLAGILENQNISIPLPSSTSTFAASATTIVAVETTSPIPSPEPSNLEQITERLAALKSPETSAANGTDATFEGKSSDADTQTVATASPLAVIAFVILTVGVWSLTRRSSSESKKQMPEVDDLEQQSETPDSVFSPTSPRGFGFDNPPMTPTSPTPLLPARSGRVQRANSLKLLPSLLRMK